MTTHTARIAPVEVIGRAACMCRRGEVCSSYAPGHALHLIQARLAQATPSEWVDALVTEVDAAAGTLTVHTVAGEAHALWNAGGAALEATPGTPVALHARYSVLAIGRARYNVAAL
ncbi:hypothetical protein [Microbacterium sp.]|uniref:hypothetical protein n=1 Tax=Microbacterium sp. TaxID=51671 RepID=UPI003A8FA33B